MTLWQIELYLEKMTARYERMTEDVSGENRATSRAGATDNTKVNLPPGIKDLSAKKENDGN